MNEFYFFISAFLVSAFGGLASMMRHNQPLKIGRCISAVLNSGMLGLSVAFVWFTQFRDNTYTILGICILLGLGGNSAIDFVLAAIKKGGFTVKLGENGNLSTKTNEDKKDENA